jgi:hypothetical protein
MPPMQREQGDTRKDGAGGCLKEPALLRFLFSVPANWCKNGHILLSIF